MFSLTFNVSTPWVIAGTTVSSLADLASSISGGEFNRRGINEDYVSPQDLSVQIPRPLEIFIPICGDVVCSIIKHHPPFMKFGCSFIPRSFLTFRDAISGQASDSEQAE
jgi:hypothetical protein